MRTNCARWRGAARGVPRIVISALLCLMLTPLTARADVVLEWNATAVNAALQANQTPYAQARYTAIVQLAVFTAVNAITGDYEPYVEMTADSGASADAASRGEPAPRATDSGDIVVFWNLKAINTILATPLGPTATPLGSRAMAMVHVAMADAIASIHPAYKPYAVRVTGHRNADKVAAAASAAHGILVRLFPASQEQLDVALADSLAQVADGKAKDTGIALGDEVAAGVVALRAGDGSNVILPYTPPVGLGYWQPDPRTGASPFLSWAYVTPWTLDTPSQFRPGLPTSIYGQRFAEDLAESKAIGGLTSSVRTLDQECIARFATDNPVAQYYRLARSVATVAPSDLEHTARAFAVFGLSLADAFISSFDAKFTYQFWRPWTAVQNAAAIGLPDLQDSTWLSLIPTPAHPEYPANHGVQSGAIVTVLKYFYGPDVPPVTLTCQGTGCRSDICPAAYTFSHLDDFKTLFGLARIYGGIHYRNTIEVSWMEGEAIAQNIINKFYVRTTDEN